MKWKFNYITYHYKLLLLFISLLGCKFSYGLHHVTETGGDNYFQKFSLSKQGDKIFVAWSVIPVQQNTYYEIERADKLMKFKTVGILFPEENTPAPGNYIFKDKLKRIGKTKILYYRIKQINVNGEAIFSSIISVDLKEYKASLKLTFINNCLHNYFYCAEKQLQKTRINNKVAGILRNTFVSVKNNYTTKGNLA